MPFNRKMSFSIAPFKGKEPPHDARHINLHVFIHGSTSGKRNCTWTVPDKVRIVFFYDPYKSDTVIYRKAGDIIPMAYIDSQIRYVLEPGQTYTKMPCFHMISDTQSGVFAADGEELIFTENLLEEGSFGGQPAERVLNILTHKIRETKNEASGKTSLKDVVITYYLYMCSARDLSRKVATTVLNLNLHGGKRRKGRRSSRRSSRRSTRRSTRRTRRKV